MIKLCPRQRLLYSVVSYRISITFALDRVRHTIFLGQNINPEITTCLGHFHIGESIVLQQVRAKIFKLVALHRIHDYTGIRVTPDRSAGLHSIHFRNQFLSTLFIQKAEP